MMSISALRSLPLTTSLLTPPSPGCVSTLVVTPSITDSARPLICTTSTTRISGRLPPPVSRNSVRSGERAGRSNVSSKPALRLARPGLDLHRASAPRPTHLRRGHRHRADEQRELDAALHDALTCPGGSGMIDAPAQRVGQLVRIDHRVGVGDAPVQQRSPRYVAPSRSGRSPARHDVARGDRERARRAE